MTEVEFVAWIKEAEAQLVETIGRAHDDLLDAIEGSADPGVIEAWGSLVPRSLRPRARVQE